MSSHRDTVRVLHVDDDPDLAEMTATFLERESEHFDVETAIGASEGLDRIAEEPIDCVVSDYDMPGRTGIEFLGAVREERPDLPFILYTGKGSEEVASEAISAGVTDYLQKEGGTGQYAVLANRIENAVEQYRTSRRAAELDRLRALASQLNQELVRTGSPSEVKTRVCEIFSESDPYRFAWIGTVDLEAGRVEPEVSAGVDEGYLDEITITTDDAATGRGPGGTAIRERRVAVSQNIVEDPEFEPWRQDAIERGFEACAAVPLEYQDTLYGELVVYAERSHPFDTNERDLLAELGGNIAHVLHSFNVREQLREEHDFIEQALDSLTDVFYAVNTDGTFRRWNDQLEAVTGYSTDELAEMEAIDLFPADEQARVAEAIEETFSTGETTISAEFQTADGDRVPYEFTGSRLTGPDGDLLGLIGIGRSLTEHKRRERRLQRLIDNLPGIVYRCRNEPGWPMEDLSGEVAELTGYGPSELEDNPGMYGEEVIHPDDRDAVWETIQDALDDRESFEITYRIQTKDGAVKWVWERGRGIFSDGDVTAIEGFITDVTKQERHRRAIGSLHGTAQSIMRAETAEDAAQIAVETVHDVLDMPASAVHLFEQQDGEGVLVPVTWTGPTEEIVGEPPTLGLDDSLAGAAFEAGQPLTYDDVSTVPGRFNPDTPVRSEVVLPLDDHGVLIIESTTPAAFDDVDISLAETVAAHTTTALDRIERERELEEKNERLEEFTRIASHDLRSPLTVARGRVELAMDESDDENLAAAMRAIDRMQELLDDLLEVARRGSGADDLEPVAVADLVADCWENVDTADATLEVTTDRTVRADRSRLAQLLENVIRNAVEHGSTSGRTESDDSVEHGKDEPDADGLTITIGDLDDGFYVADDGPGIPDAERAQIFDAGYSTRPDGTGFGLAIVEEVADAHGWAVDVTESESGGARFEVTGLDDEVSHSQT